MEEREAETRAPLVVYHGTGGGKGGSGYAVMVPRLFPNVDAVVETRR